MKISHRFVILLLAAVGTACDSPAGPAAPSADMVALNASNASPHINATGTFNQTAITSLVTSQAGPNTTLDQTSSGWISGTLAGSYTDDLKVVIHPNGNFNAHFTIRCECTVGGEQGILNLVASDRGELVSPTLASFSGRATITGGTGDLADLKGVLAIEGTIDVTTGLATYTYSGSIH
ncbi:MAG TPA: hypothetical protein VHG09_03530 [Longimicrobiales bacterium]|nr:hypothetical protein [Longimicrobiales bacterium]